MATIGLIPVIGRILSILLIFVVALINGSTTFIDMDNADRLPQPNRADRKIGRRVCYPKRIPF